MADIPGDGGFTAQSQSGKPAERRSDTRTKSRGEKRQKSKLRKPLGYYGRLLKAYLGMHRPILFNELVLSDKLFEHCADIPK